MDPVIGESLSSLYERLKQMDVDEASKLIDKIRADLDTLKSSLSHYDEAKERDTIIFGEPLDWEKQSIKRFRSLSFEQLDKLLKNGHIDPDERQNFGPTVDEFHTFLENHDADKFKLLGYAVSPKRPDYRVAIEGIRAVDANEEQLDSFIEEFRDADEFNVSIQEGTGRAWWD